MSDKKQNIVQRASQLITDPVTEHLYVPEARRKKKKAQHLQRDQEAAEGSSEAAAGDAGQRSSAEADLPQEAFPIRSKKEQEKGSDSTEGSKPSSAEGRSPDDSSRHDKRSKEDKGKRPASPAPPDGGTDNSSNPLQQFTYYQMMIINGPIFRTKAERTPVKAGGTTKDLDLPMGLRLQRLGPIDSASRSQLTSGRLGSNLANSLSEQVREQLNQMLVAAVPKHDSTLELEGDVIRATIPFFSNVLEVLAEHVLHAASFNGTLKWRSENTLIGEQKELVSSSPEHILRSNKYYAEALQDDLAASLALSLDALGLLIPGLITEATSISWPPRCL